MALNARMRARASSTVLPLMAADIIEADDWLIEHPWPEIFTSCNAPSSRATYTTTSSPHSGLNPSVRSAGGTGRSPRFRGLR